MTNNKIIAIPPGETIKEQLDMRNISKEDLAKTFNMSITSIDELLQGKLELTIDIANNLEKLFKISSNFWLNLEATYREKLRKIKEVEYERAKE